MPTRETSDTTTAGAKRKRLSNAPVPKTVEDIFPLEKVNINLPSGEGEESATDSQGSDDDLALPPILGASDDDESEEEEKREEQRNKEDHSDASSYLLGDSEDSVDEKGEETDSEPDVKVGLRGKAIISDITGRPKRVYPNIEPDYDSDSSTEDVGATFAFCL